MRVHVASSVVLWERLEFYLGGQPHGILEHPCGIVPRTNRNPPFYSATGLTYSLYPHFISRYRDSYDGIEESANAALGDISPHTIGKIISICSSK